MKNHTQQPDFFPVTYEADITVASTEDTPERLVHVELDPQETERVQEIADDCGMTLDAFVRASVGPGLPAQTHWRGPGLDEYPYPSLKFEGLSPELRARLERAAEFKGGMSLEEYVYATVAARVEADEQTMLFNVETGAVVEHLHLGFDLRRHEELTAPTLREQRGEIPRSILLSPGYEERWAARLPSPGVSPLAAACQRISDGEPVEPLRVTLSPEATLVLLRFHQVTGDQLLDIINGVLVGQLDYTLECADKRDTSGWRLTTEDIAAAVRVRKERGWDRQHDVSAFEHTVLVPLPPAAHALLKAAALDGEHGTVESLVRELCMGECRIFAEAITDPERPALDALFNLHA